MNQGTRKITGSLLHHAVEYTESRPVALALGA